MRLIDADKLYPDCLSKNGRLAISQNQLANAQTIEPTYISDLPDDKVKDLQELAIDYGEGIAVFERKRPKGEWILIKNSDGYLKCYECSECKKIQGYISNFCEDCGADMGGSKNESNN